MVLDIGGFNDKLGVLLQVVATTSSSSRQHAWCAVSPFALSSSYLLHMSGYCCINDTNAFKSRVVVDFYKWV